MTEENDYPETIVIDEISYRVSVDRDSDGLVEYFNLQDDAGEIIYEFDYQASPLTEDDIRSCVAEEEAREALNNPAGTGMATGDQTDEEILADAARMLREADEKFFGTILEEDYPQYGGLGPEFRAEAIEKLRMFRNESQAFQDIVLDELADNYED